MVNLNVLPLGSYDILIGMYWLESHKVLLNFYEKSFVYQDKNKAKRIVQGLRKLVSVRQLSTMHLNKYIIKGCQLYEIQVLNMQSEDDKPKLEDCDVLINFKDVFADEIPELPPIREIDFSIDLILGVAPVSKAPYKMSTPELT